MGEGRRLQESLDEQREVYRPVAHAAASMFFVIRDLAKVSHMYQFSLPMFVRLFDRALKTETAAESVQERIRLLVELLQKLVLGNIARSLFKADRLTFAMHFAHAIRPDMFGDGEWELFSGQSTADPTGDAAASVNLPDWVPAERGEAVRALAVACPTLFSVIFSESADAWAAWCAAPQCETEFPRRLDKSVSAFQRLLVVQALRPDRLVSSMHSFACMALSVQSLSGVSSSLQHLYEDDTRAAEPILLITTPGADPTADVVELATKIVGRQRFDQVRLCLL